MPIPQREPSALQVALERARDPGIVSLALGLPSPEVLPSRELAEASAAVLGDPGSLQYGLPEAALKGHIVELMRLRGVACGEDEVFVTTGAQQGLSLLAQLLLPASDGSVLVEDGLYPGCRQALELRSARMVPLPVSIGWGVDVQAAARHLRAGLRPAFLYTVPVGHNPLGFTMAAGARRELVEFAARHRVPVVEDDVYGFLQYDGAPAPPLRQTGGERVFYVGSLSKIVAPALRLGWIIAPRDTVPTLSVLREASELNTASLGQRIACRYLGSVSMPQRLERLRSHYRSRRDAMQRALSRQMPSGTKWLAPSAGFFFWVQGAVLGDSAVLLEEALRRRVAFVPGSAFDVHGDGRYGDAMRLSSSHCSTSLIEEGVDRLAAAVLDRAGRMRASA